MNFDISETDAEISAHLASIEKDAHAEIAFFGGSFTGIERGDMTSLLETAHKYVRAGRVSSIRLSTRPDYIDDEILGILKRFGVKTIELGIQSLCDDVLTASGRGHTSEQSVRACAAVVGAGFFLIGQMMVGLPRSSPDDEIFTAGRLCELGVSGARIYPTAVLRKTALERMTQNGEYTPLTVDEAVQRAAGALEVFAQAGVPVIRIGLCASDILGGDDGIIAGGYHPAVGEMAESVLFLKRIRAGLDEFSKDKTKGAELTILCPRGCVSKVSGHKKQNKLQIMREYSVKKIHVVESDTISGYNVIINLKTEDTGEGASKIT